MTAIAQNIRSARQTAKLSQHKLARVLDVTDRTVARWEASGATPDLSTLRRVADALGVTLSTLVEES